MRGIGHVAGCIVRAVETLAASGWTGLAVIVEDIAVEEWASATFEGYRHRLQMRLEGSADLVGAATARIVAGLAEMDIPLSGQFVADIAVPVAPLVSDATGTRQVMIVDALTLFD